MKLKRRLLAAASLAVIGAVLVTGCGRDGGTGGSAGSAGPSAIADGKATGTIKLWAQGSEADALADIVKGFEAENPDAKVEVTPIPWASAVDKYQAAIAAGQTPDVAMMGSTYMANFAASFDEVPAQVDTSKLFPSTKPLAQVQGKTLGVPWYVDTRVIYYRTDLAEKAGYTTPPATLDELKTMAKAMQDKAGAKYGIAIANAASTDPLQWQFPYLYSNGAALTDQDQTKWTFDTPEMLKAWEWVNSFFTEGIADKQYDQTKQEANFINGSTPILMSGSWEVNSLVGAAGESIKDKIGVTPIPKGTSSTSFLGGSNLVVFKGSKNRDSSWKLVQYLMQPKVQLDLYKATGDMPSSQATWDEEPIASNTALKAFRTQLASAVPPPAVTTYTQVNSAANTQIEQVIRGGGSPAEALKALQSTADGIGFGN